MSLLRRFSFVLLLVPVLATSCFADTLYERSMALFKAKELTVKPGEYTFVVLGDSRDGDAVFRRALKLAGSFDPVFILHGGDYSARGGEAETANFLAMVKETVPDVPLFVVIGNHENRDIFARQIGPDDFTLQSERLGLTLVAVDDSADALKPGELAYLRSHLSSAAPLRFVAMHVPPKTDQWSWHSFTEGADQLKKILAEDKVSAAFFSHVHLFASSEYGGVPAFITGGAGAPLVTRGFPGDPVFHIVVVTVKDGKATFRKVSIPE